MYVRDIEGRELTFRIHPDLYQENLIIQDVETGSRWSQLARKAIRGQMKGKKLSYLPSLQTTWAEWKKRFPQTLVLSQALGVLQEKDRYPKNLTPTRRLIHGLYGYEIVMGIEMGEHQKAYPFSQLEKMQSPFEDRVGSQSLRVHFIKSEATAFATDLEGRMLPAVTARWKQWYLFYPQTTVFVARR